MTDLIVSNNNIKTDTEVLGWDNFLEMAGSDEGLHISGNLYIDIDGLDEDLYETILDAIPDTIFFTIDGSSKPSFVERMEDWSEIKNKESLAIANQSSEEAASSEEYEYDFIDEENDHQARIILFGSSKGGTGKTFTCLMSAYRYAKSHPNERVAVSDFDIVDGQVGITVHKISPTMLEYYKQYKFGEDDFDTMSKFKTESANFPDNLDFYLAPRDYYIEDDDFWDSIFINLIENYDTVFFDTGIDYLNYKPISTIYKIADKVILVSTTSIKSVSSVAKQIKRLKGEINNDVFSKEDNMGDKLNLVITQARKGDEINTRVFATFQPMINIVGVFGVITGKIQQAEYFGKWDIFDDKKYTKTIDKIVE